MSGEAVRVLGVSVKQALSSLPGWDGEDEGSGGVTRWRGLNHRLRCWQAFDLRRHVAFSFSRDFVGPNRSENRLVTLAP